MDTSNLREWHMFLGTRDGDTAAHEVMRLAQRLDEAFDIVSYVLRLVAGSPGAETEETLRVARTVLSEGVEDLQKLANEFRHHTDVA